MSKARSPRFDCSTTMGTSVLLKTSTGSLIALVSLRGAAGASRPARSRLRLDHAARFEPDPDRRRRLPPRPSSSSRNSSSRDGRLLDDLHLPEDVVDRLLLEDRRPQLGLAPAGSSGRTPRPAAPGPGYCRTRSTSAWFDLLVGDLDIGLLADLRKDEPEPHAALGDLAVFARAPSPRSCPRPRRCAPLFFRSASTCARPR